MGLAGVKKLLFLGSSCIYPKHAPQPMSESALLTGTLESTNEPYAIAKIAGIKLCESYNRQYGTDYRSVMPAKPDGTARKLMDSTRLNNLGWQASVPLEEGLRLAYIAFIG
jgi:nucleoside-diphosphate-sugar epimerase